MGWRSRKSAGAHHSTLFSVLSSAVEENHLTLVALVPPQATLTQPRIVSAGSLPPGPPGLRLTHNSHRVRLRVKLEEDEGTFDQASSAWLYPEAPQSAIALPITIQLGVGQSLTFDSTSDFFQPVRKGGEGCACACAVTQKLCLSCSFNCFALVKIDEESKTIADCGFCLHGRSACHEALLVLLLEPAADAGLPDFFAPGLPRGVSKTQVFQGDAGCTKASVPWFGWTWVQHFGCTHPGPEGPCGAEVHVGAKPGETHVLQLAFSGSHTHASGFCAGDCGSPGARPCADCLAGGLLPLPLPSPGADSGLSGASLLFRVRGSMAASAEASPKCLLAAACSLASPREQLYCNTARTGSGQENWGTLLAAERARKLREDGVLPVLSPAQGGPTTSLGHSLEELARSLCAHAHTHPSAHSLRRSLSPTACAAAAMARAPSSSWTRRRT